MLLSVEDLTVRFATEDGTVHAVNGISFDVEAGETLGIVGESGCGKSAMGLAIMRLLPKGRGTVAGGRVAFQGTDLFGLSERNMRGMRGKDLAMVFQDPLTSLNPVLTIGRQLTEVLTAHRKSTRADAVRRSIELLDRVEIPDPDHMMRRYPHQLSGGMRQRMMIAMALALEPRLLIADEPTTALDVTIQAQVLELIKTLTRDTGTAVILITHDLGVVASMTQRVCVMYAGYLVEIGRTTDIFARPTHPYTVGLLNSIPRLDDEDRQALVPIEGAPPDQLIMSVGCPFAPRCAWRIGACWNENPRLEARMEKGDGGEFESGSPHRVACHNRVAAGEVSKGQPIRPGFTPASPPAPGSLQAASGPEATPP